MFRWALCFGVMWLGPCAIATADEAEARNLLADEIRVRLLPELEKFKQSGSRDWGRMAEKKIIIPAHNCPAISQTTSSG